VTPTRPPDDRRARHEATGEWPQPSLSTLLAARARAHPDAVYLIEGAREGGRSFTYGELARRADRMAVALGRLGIAPGDVVSWQLPNWMEGGALAAAIDRLGGVSNPIITIYREREMTFVCREAGSRVLVVPGQVRSVDHRELAAAVKRSVPSLEHVLTVRAEPAPGQRALESLEDAPGAPLPPTPLGPHDVSAVFYTSGTTADPKGVLHTPSTLGAVHHFHAATFGASADERSLLQFPLTHIGGLVMFVLVPIANGSSVVFMDGFDPALAVDLVERHRVTAAGGPPAVLQAMFGAPNFSTHKMRSVRWSGSGAADVSPELIREAGRKMGAIAYRSYGMTECPMFTSGRRDDPEEKRYETDGRPVPGAVARVVDDAGRPVAAGIEGEVEAYGPQLCVGYLNPRLNDAFTADGFFRTGDLAVMDAEGYVRITGRRKDIIIRKGENISAREIEDAIATHPAVAEVAVVGIPDPAAGEIACAVVRLRPGTPPPSLAALVDHLRAGGLSTRKLPERLEIVEDFPRAASGKIVKRVLRERFR